MCDSNTSTKGDGVPFKSVLGRGAEKWGRICCREGSCLMFSYVLADGRD